MERVAPVVDETIRALAQTKFVQDPVAGMRYSRATSIISSAYTKDVRRLVVERRREHSRKPDCVRERIERLVAGPYLELFARETKEGWECWGDQVALFDNGAVPTRRQPSRLVDAPALSL
jgi:N6-adenosine-specific RNA methylase IME4